MRKAFVAGVLALAFGSIVRAQGVTEEEFLAAFGEGHDAVRALTGGIGQAEAARERAGVFSNPRLEFWREEPDDNPRLTNWALAWTPPLDGRYGPGKKAAEAGLVAAHEGYFLDRAALRRDIRRVFAGWSIAFERHEVQQRQLALVARLAGQERERARLGEASGLAARRLLLVEGEARLALDATEADCARTGALARGWRPDLPAGTEPARVVLPEPPAALEIEGSPALRLIEGQIEQAGHDARRAGRYWGFPTLVLGWQTLEDHDVSQSGPILAASWAVPLFDRDQGGRLEAERRQAVAAARLRNTRARMAAEVEGGVAAYRTLYDSALVARENAREVETVIEAATRVFRAGESDLTDLLETLRSAFAAALREIDARDRALAVHQDLEARLGRPLAIGGPR